MHFLAIAGGVPPVLELAVLIFVVGGFLAMIWAALVCLRKKSPKAGITAVAIILVQAAVMQPWRFQEPFNASDADEVADIKQGRQIKIAWMAFSAVSFAIVTLAFIRRKEEPNQAPEPTAPSGRGSS